MSDQEMNCCCAGCGFLDTVTKLIKLGSNVNARDLTQCTPLQNAAHGTYSALATMPLNGSQGGASYVPLHLGLPPTLSVCVEPSIAHVPTTARELQASSTADSRPSPWTEHQCHASIQLYSLY